MAFRANVTKTLFSSLARRRVVPLPPSERLLSLNRRHHDCGQLLEHRFGSLALVPETLKPSSLLPSLFSRRSFCGAGSPPPPPPKDEGEEEVEEGEVLEGELVLPATPELAWTDKQKEDAAEIGYKVVGRASPEDFQRRRPPASFAIVQVGSHQFKISPGDCIYTEKLKYADVNDKLCLEKVMLLGTKTKTIIGRPIVPGAFVHAAVEEHALDAKVIIFKKKRRKNYRRTRGHRQELTRLRIIEIQGLSSKIGKVGKFGSSTSKVVTESTS